MIESMYDLYLLYRSSSFAIVEMQTDDKLILVDNNLAGNEEKEIKVAKLMTKNCKYLTSSQPIKFNGAQIKPNLNGIVLIKESYVGDILLVTDYDTDSTGSKKIMRKKLSLKEQYLAQMTRSAYNASVCQPEASFNLFRAD